MTPEKWQVRKVHGYWTVIPPSGEVLTGYARAMGGYPFGRQSDSFPLACVVLRRHLDGERERHAALEDRAAHPHGAGL